MSEGLVDCPRCKGTWWRREETVQIPEQSPYPQPPDMAAQIRSGSAVTWIPFSSGCRYRYVCVGCGFPHGSLPSRLQLLEVKP